MKIKIPVFIFMKLTEKYDFEEDSPYNDYHGKYASANDEVTIDTSKVPDFEYNEIISKLKEYSTDAFSINDVQLSEHNTQERNIAEFNKIKKMISNALARDKKYQLMLKRSSSQRITSLSGMPTVVEVFCKNLPNSRFFEINDLESMEIIVPWVIYDCRFVPAVKSSYGDGTPPHVTITFKAVKLNEEITRSLTFYSKDIRYFKENDAKHTYHTVESLLDSYELYAENDELNAKYDKDFEKYQKLIRSTGKVYVGSGPAKRVSLSKSSWSDRIYRSESVYWFKTANSDNKVVIDHEGVNTENSSEKQSAGEKIITATSQVTAQDIVLPVHTFIHCFHLNEHIWLSCHVSCVDEYQYAGKTLMDKLVLPAHHKTLINILLQSSKIDIKDIIAGKQGGSIVIATGEPGTGKTLTAEVFSESIELPLYKVQCSQLGISVNDVEKNLQTVLLRAIRWGAILLIDEADVYVRARGEDIQQNAIVGVFLRTLEYYTGILFLTSNMGSTIDDAIMSRATAHIEYQRPSKGELYSIWTILSREMKLNISDSDIHELISRLPNIVGRDVKSLLKLAKMYYPAKDSIVANDIDMLASFAPNVRKHLKL